jgi:hypothetical protein
MILTTKQPYRGQKFILRFEKGKKQTGKPKVKLTKQLKLIENQTGKVTAKKADVFVALLFEMDTLCEDI